MRIEIYTESQKQVWDDFVRESKNGTFLFFRDYIDYHQDRFEDHSLLIWDEKKQPIAILPANKRDGKLISHEGLTYGGLITNEKMKTPLMLEVFECAFSFLVEHNFTQLIYKTVPYIYHRLPAEEDRYALFLCQAQFIRRGVLTVVTNQQRPMFQARRSRGVKKALSNGLVVRESDDLEAFWDILSKVLHNVHNTHPVHTLQEIELLHSRFPENIRLFTCFKEDEMLAGVVIFESGRVAHVQYIASNEHGRTQGALDLVISHLLTTTYCNKPFFDFGTSDEDNGTFLNGGLVDQKEGFGARAVVHDHYLIQLTQWIPGSFTQALIAPNERKDL